MVSYSHTHSIHSWDFLTTWVTVTILQTQFCGIREMYINFSNGAFLFYFITHCINYNKFQNEITAIKSSATQASKAKLDWLKNGKIN